MKENELAIEYRDPGTLKLWKYNPRLNDKAVPAVKKSIETYGFLIPIVIGPDDVVKAGNTRLKAALELGLTKIPTIRAEHLTEDELDEFALADNKTGEIAEWDLSMLTKRISLTTLQYVPGFDAKDLEKINAYLVKEASKNSPEGLPEGPKGKSRLSHTCPNCNYTWQPKD